MSLKRQNAKEVLLTEPMPIYPRKTQLKINSNENLFLPKRTVMRAVTEAMVDFDPRLYPDDEELILKKRLAEMLGTDPECLVIESGGDRVIDLVISSLLKENERILAIEPTFSMYPRTAEIRRVNYKRFMLNSQFDFDPSKLLEASEDVDMILLCNPNNPTGNQFKREQVEAVVEGFNGPVLVDEAYVDFSEYSLEQLAVEADNLILLRTFSKAFGLAGLRLGYMVTKPELASDLNDFYRQPYPASSFAMRVAVNMIKRRSILDKAVNSLKSERGRALKKLNKINGVRAFPSSTNFILFNSMIDYLELYDRLLSAGIIVRRIGEVPGYSNCLRATVAPRTKMRLFFDAMEDVFE